MPDLIFDPVLGALRDVLGRPDDERRLYQGSVELESFGGSVGVMLETTASLGVTDAQRAAFTDFVTHQSERKRQVLQAMFEKYRDEWWVVYADAIGPAFADRLAPKVADVSAFEALLSAPSLFLHQHALSLSYECTWDVEHGIGARFEGNQVVEVGLAGDV